jgi:hypothetical protein
MFPPITVNQWRKSAFRICRFRRRSRQLMARVTKNRQLYNAAAANLQKNMLLQLQNLQQNSQIQPRIVCKMLHSDFEKCAALLLPVFLCASAVQIFFFVFYSALST